MATVNRFFRPNSIAQVQPIPLEQLALVPQYMRQQHNAAEQTALENSILQADTLTAQDQELARQFLDPLEQKSEKVIDNLTKNGFSQDIKSDLTGILVNKKKLERDVLGPLKARKEAYQAKVEEIEEFFKDDPEAKRNRLAALQATTFASQSEINPNNGKLKVGAVGDPFYANRLDTSELNKILLGNKQLLDTIDLKYNIKSEDVIKRGDDLWAVIQEKSTSKLEADRIYSTIMNSLGSDVKDSFRMEAAMETGIAGRDISMAKYMDNVEEKYGSSQVREVFNERMNTIAEARKVTEIMNSEGFKAQPDKNKGKYLEKEKAKYLKSNELKQDQQEIAKQMQNKPAIDFLADLKMEEKFKNLSGNMAIYKSLTNTKYLAMDGTEKSIRDARDLENRPLLPTMPGGRVSTKAYSPFYDSALNPEFSQLKIRTQANKNLYKKFAEEEGYFLHDGQVDKDGNYTLRVTKDAEGKKPLSAADMNNFAEKYNIDEAVNAIKNPETNKELQEFISKDSRLQKVKEEQGSKKALEKINNFYGELGQQYGNVTVFEESTRKRFKDIYDNSLNNIAYTLPDGRTVDIEEFQEHLGLESTSEIKEKGYSISGNRNVFGMGNAIEASFVNSDGKDVTVYLEPPKEFNKKLLDVQPISTAVDQAIIRMGEEKLPFMKLDTPDLDYKDEQGRITPVYYTVVPNYDTGEIMLYGSQDPNLDMSAFVGKEEMMPEENTGIYSLSEVISTEKEYADAVIQSYSLQDKNNK